MRHVIGVGRQVSGLRKDGSLIPLDLAVTEFELEGERHFAAVLRDLTAQQALERQVRVSQRMEAFGQLAGGVAHDFNNLLTVILGNSSLSLQRRLSESTRHDSMMEIHRAGERAASLTRQLLAFSRQQMLEPKVVDLNEIVTRTARMLQRLIGEDIRLSANLDPSVLAIEVDPGQMEQVLLNLAVNARDAMPDGGRLSIETARIERREEQSLAECPGTPGPCVVLSVSDSGCGMTAETQARIFEPFFTTKELGKGTGLGLATVFGIIKQSDGRIDVHSEVGRGTTFRIYLPLADASAVQSLRDRQEEKPQLGTETILIVEDEPGVRQLACRTLEALGYTVIEADGPQTALELTERHQKIDLMISDVVMPEMNGRELTQRVRERRPDLPVLLMSGYTSDALVRLGDLGKTFIQKPFLPTELSRKVRALLDSPRGTSSESAPRPATPTRPDVAGA